MAKLITEHSAPMVFMSGTPYSTGPYDRMIAGGGIIKVGDDYYSMVVRGKVRNHPDCCTAVQVGGLMVYVGRYGQSILDARRDDWGRPTKPGEYRADPRNNDVAVARDGHYVDYTEIFDTVPTPAEVAQYGWMGLAVALHGHWHAASCYGAFGCDKADGYFGIMKKSLEAAAKQWPKRGITATTINMRADSANDRVVRSYVGNPFKFSIEFGPAFSKHGEGVLTGKDKFGAISSVTLGSSGPIDYANTSPRDPWNKWTKFLRAGKGYLAVVPSYTWIHF